jgi:hypothetical protein
VETTYAVGGSVDFDFVHGGDARRAIAHIPRDWDYVVDDARRDHPGLRAMFPHTGFGMAALAVGTPWLALSGNRWPEYFYNNVPFYSVLPDPDRFACYNQLGPDPPLVPDRDGEGPRSPSMCADRIDDDLDEFLWAAGLLIERGLSYDQAMAGHFQRLLRFFHGRASLVWSVDHAHADYVDPSSFDQVG